MFSYAGDLGLKWKHNAWVNWSNDDWSATLTQVFRGTYANQKLPGIANGTVVRPGFNAKVDPYSIFHLSVSYLGLGPNYKLTWGSRTCSIPIRRTPSLMTATPVPAARGSRAWPIRAAVRSPWRLK